MKAVKENKIYTITEEAKATYLSQGYDMADDNGNIIERSPLSKVSYSEYVKVLSQLEKIKTELAGLKGATEVMGDAELKKIKATQKA
ncbi:MAG: hypothetical protein QM644_18415 [Mobilitalea sp.]